MTLDVIGASSPPTTPPAASVTGATIGDTDTWGTITRFRRLTRVQRADADYWTRVVSRPAHRMGHPNLTIQGCPGCLFETAVDAQPKADHDRPEQSRRELSAR
jgi:hypothetical protein